MGFAKMSFLLILVLCSALLAKYTSAELEVNIDWSIVVDGNITSANLSVSIPSNSSNQKVTSIQISEPYTLEMNGSIWRAVIHLSNFSEKTVKGKFIVFTDYISRYLSSSESFQDGSFLESTSLVDINNDIRSIAHEFSSLPFPNNTIGMNKWVHEAVKYDKAYTGESDPASLVMANKRGTCDEYSHLLIALARSIGLPSRIIVGYIYANDSWTPHAWVEVYDKNWGWVEVDPTHDEFFNLDALRVRLSTGSDQEETKDKIEAIGFAKDLSFSSSAEISILKKSNDSKVDVNLQLTAQPVNSTHQPITVSVRNRNKYPVFLTAMLAVPQGLDCNCSDDLLLQPGENKELAYDLNLSGLLPDVKYNFSVKALTEYGSAEASFTRLIVVQEYSSVKELPQSFMIFIGIAVVVAIVLIITAVMMKW